MGDFGLVKEIRHPTPFTEYVSTRWYRAPENVLGSRSYNYPVDIFALGCIMAELYTFKPLFPGTSEMDQFQKISNILGKPSFQAEFSSVVTSLLINDYIQVRRASPPPVQ